MLNLDEIQAGFDEVAHQQDWKKLHNPKSLAIALAVEAAELLQPIQWVAEDQLDTLLKDEDQLSRLKDEAADVLMYLVAFSSACGIDLEQAVMEKMKKNRRRWGVADQ